LSSVVVIEPATMIVTGPSAWIWPWRFTVSLQTVYVPAASLSVPGPSPPPETKTLPSASVPPGVGGEIVMVPSWGTKTLVVPQVVGNGFGAPQAAAMSGMIGIGTGVAGPHFPAAVPPFAKSALQLEDDCSATKSPKTFDVAASMRLVPISVPFVPMSPFCTLRPRARNVWSPNSTNAPVADVTTARAGAAKAQSAARESANTQADRLMSSPSKCPVHQRFHTRGSLSVTWPRVGREGRKRACEA
jgi:hypothetical protein